MSLESDSGVASCVITGRSSATTTRNCRYEEILNVVQGGHRKCLMEKIACKCNLMSENHNETCPVSVVFFKNQIRVHEAVSDCFPIAA